MAEPVKLLLIEDNMADSRLIGFLLRESKHQKYVIKSCGTFMEGLHMLQNEPFDLIILDLSLPDSVGLETLQNANDAAPETPIIVLTGTSEEDFAVEVVEAGAQDYLVKGEITSPILSRAIRYAVKRKKMEVDLKRAESSLRQNNSELTRVNKILDNFVHIISHDLKKPAANIIGLLAMFETETDKDSAKSRFIVEKLGYSANQLKKMIDDLLRSIREEIAVEQQVVAVEFDKLYTEVAISMEQSVVTAHATVVTDFSNCRTIYYPYQDLKSILSNLLSNAIKYQFPGRDPIINICTDIVDGHPVLIVADNGLGIDLEKDSDKLFKKFQRLQNETEGTGLGLWIIKELVEKNGGQVKVESELNKGTTFRVIF